MDEDSQVFDLAVYPFVGGGPVSIIQDVGMFAFPKPSPQRVLESGERAFKVAFLVALEPRRSRTSSYQLMLMDQDGSNLLKIFPSGEGKG